MTQKGVENLRKPLTINDSFSLTLFPYPQDARKLKIILQMNFKHLAFNLNIKYSELCYEKKTRVALQSSKFGPLIKPLLPSFF